MTQQTTAGYPKTASILALAGSVLIILCGVLFMAVSIFIIPHVDFTNVNRPPMLTPGSVSTIASGVLGVMGLLGLVSGIIVLVSAVMLLSNQGQPRTWGVLTLIFSVLSFLGLGGFVIGAVLGIVGGILALRWKPPTQ